MAHRPDVVMNHCGEDQENADCGFCRAEVLLREKYHADNVNWYLLKWVISFWEDVVIFTFVQDEVEVLIPISLGKMRLSHLWDTGQWGLNALARAGFTTVGQVCNLTEERLMDIPGFGKRSLEEVVQLLGHFKLGLRPQEGYIQRILFPGDFPVIDLQ